MGKISDYANVLKSKLTDLFVVYQSNNGELETKNATVEQIGDAICGEQVHADLETDDQTIIGGINENKTAIGNKSNTLLVERKTAQVTMDNYYKSATISLTKTGYTAIGIVGYQTNMVGVVCFRNNIEGTNAIVGLVNRDGTTALGANVDLYIDVLYLKN